MKWRDAMQATARATRPEPEARRRVRRRLDLASRPLPPSLREDPTGHQLSRVRTRLAHRRPARAGPRIALVTGTLIVGAAAALGALRARGPAPVASEPELVQISGEALLQPSPFVTLRADGEGWVSGTERDLQVSWERGEVLVEVEPDQGVSLEVVTSEGKAWVTGTAFRVARDDRGTDVEVLRGRVEVRCAIGTAASLEALDSTRCLPATPGTLLNQARLMMLQDTPPEEVLVVLDDALSAAGPGFIRSELLAQRAVVLHKMGRDAEVLEAIEAYESEGGGIRSAQLTELAARIAP
jgi:ferric-dicitrate binding protein FerR (iron transport regulator)